jgi:Domain of Unknown Function (DUF349)
MENEKELEEKVLEKTPEVVSASDESNPSLDESPLHIEEDSEEAEDQRPSDYTQFSKKDFVELAKELALGNDVKRIDSVTRDIRPLYNEIRGKEKAAALERFKEDGGIAEDFEFKGDDSDHLFDATLKLLRDKRNQHFKNLEDQKVDNLKKKEAILEKLRTLSDQEDNDQGFHQFKQLQHEWKTIGPVATAHVKTLWANYGALVDRFYDHRSIYFELKELDRKKNLEIKLDLCQKAEQLIKVDRIQQAVRELNELHNEFKHVGPVPKEDKDTLWQRFKTASDSVYARRDAHVSQLQGELQKNLEAKLLLGEELAVFAAFNSDKIKEWNQRTQEILNVQKKWEAIGAIPRAKSKDINKKFWTAFKGFFNNKNLFFKKLDEGRDKNLQLKNEIIQKAIALKDSSDWDKTANDLKVLQQQWKDVGPVPEKVREKIYQEFKAACDHFFEHRRSQFEKADIEQEENLKQKEALCAELEQLAASKSGSLGHLSELQNKFNGLGFVPKKSIITIKNRFSDAVNKLVSTLEISSHDKDKAMLEISLNNLKNDPQADVKIYQKEQTIRKKMSKIENDISTLRNNLEFFGRSKNAEKMKEEFGAQIREADEQLLQLKNQLKMLRTVTS